MNSPNLKQQVLVVSCASCALFLSSYISNALSVALPVVAKQYGASAQSATYAISGYTIALAAFLLPATYLARAFSNRTVFILGAFLCGIISLVIPFSPTLTVLVVGRIAQGLAASLMLCTSMALISSFVSEKKRFIAVGIAVCLTYVGVSLSLSSSGVISDLFGYEVMFYGSGLALIALALSALFIEKSNSVRERSFVSGKLILKITLFILGVALTLLNLAALSKQPFAPFGLTAGILLVLALLRLDYVDYKNERDGILIPVHLLTHNRQFTLCFLVSFTSYVSVMAEPVILSLFSQLTLGLSASISGVIVVVQPLTIALVSFLTARIVKVLGGQLVVTLGLIIQTITLASFVFIDEQTTVSALIIRQLFVGIGFAFFSAPNTALITLSVKEQHYALASSMQQLGRTIGQAASYALVTVLLSALVTSDIKSEAYAHDFAHACVIILGISAALGISAIIFAAMAVKIRFSLRPRASVSDCA